MKYYHIFFKSLGQLLLEYGSILATSWFSKLNNLSIRVNKLIKNPIFKLFNKISSLKILITKG